MEQVLYKLPDGWKRVCVDDVCTKITDGAHKTPKYTDDGVPFLSVKDVNKGLIDFSNTRFVSQETHDDLYKRCNPERNDILYTKVGSTGVAKIVDTDREFSLFVSVALLKPKSELIDSKYFEYALNSPESYAQAQALTRGVANRNLVLKDIKSITFNFAPIKEQKRIVEKLDALLTRIDTAIEHLQESVTLADLLYASELNEIFNPRSLPINQNGIYELPHGWEWQELADVVVKTENLNPLKHADQIWTYIDISSVDRDRFAIKDPKEILGKDAPSRAKKHVQLNDVIFATTRPNLKNIALIRDEYSSPVASTGFCVLRANEKVLPAYLFYFVTTDFVQAQIEPYVGGASYPAITDGNLKKALIPIPGCEEQKRIVEKINSIGKLHVGLKEQLQFKITSLRQLKASILDSAFKGEL
ncbi:hypothetical protein FM042_06900 [Aliidiomarina halalkaliphila]|uniref:Type I restriction modification DNA specificity domain-containing protein n=1 Tax=Aliidiomarina halalkaliphila TaxID=2593535 RepID=A0A552X0X6_9GAMM|nr:restriction endonuclease subunit S [Aliidiomarina halalkaliphila]TRW48708.1 hypothetical protein FM042_06900 [Aliidiomarina halalkaliphila]